MLPLMELATGKRMTFVIGDLTAAASHRKVPSSQRWPGSSGRITVGPEGPPERPGGPRETSVLRGFKGSVKGPLEIARWSPINIRHCNMSF